VCRSRLKREDFQEVKTKEAIIESSSPTHFAKMIMFLAKIICLAFSRALCGSCPPQLRHKRVCCFPLSLKKTEHVSVVSTKTPKVNVTVTEKQCRFLLDTGATVNLLDQNTHDRIGAPI
jgi:hypothetical protein